MSAQKLSISLDTDLADTVRAAAAEDGVSVSTWLATAADAKVRNYLLGTALDAWDEEFGPVDAVEAQRLVDEARSRSIVVTPKRKSA